jgi:hypothetical protein
MVGNSAGSLFGVYALESHMGSLYAGGLFEQIDGVPMSSIASWSGSWSTLGAGPEGVTGPVYALSSRPDGLYVAGAFGSAGGTPSTSNLARWNDPIWSSVGGGTNSTVAAIAWWDLGLGGAEELFVGGDFTQCGGASGFSRVARWNGSSWSALGSGIPLGLEAPTVRALQPYDDGSGPAMYVAGSFTSAGGVASTSRLARWNGSDWQAVPGNISGTATIHSLAVHDDGCGVGLYVGGAGSLPAPAGFTSRIARFDASGWETLGTTGVDNSDGHVYALTAHVDEGAARLFVGGQIRSVSGVTSWSAGEWVNCACTTVGVPRGRGAGEVGALTTTPNPSRGDVAFEFSLTRPGRVRVSIYSPDGARLRTLLDGPQGPGGYRVTWDGRDESGKLVRSGIYFAKLDVDGASASSKLVHLR